MKKINRFFEHALQHLANRLVFLICLIYVPSVLAQAASRPGQNVKRINDPQKPIVVHRSNQTFDIILKSNPTTGYIWVLDQFDALSVKPIEHVRYAQNVKSSVQAVIGAPSQDMWRFRLNPSLMQVPRIMKITFCMIRPWTISCDIKKTFTVIYVHE